VSPPLAAFIESFVLPLLGGGTVAVRGPIRPADRDEMAEDPGELGSPALRFLRLRRAQQLAPNPDLPDPDLEELTLWIGLHNTLVFDHPERDRVWARSTTWRRFEGATRTLLTLPSTTDASEGLARHVSVGAFVQLLRRDTVVTTAAGEARYMGQPVPRRRLFFAAPPQTGQREEVVEWLNTPHAAETDRLVEDVMRTSPLTCLLVPRQAPPGWSPLQASDFLQSRGIARSIVYAWARDPDWVGVGAAVTTALLPSVPLPRGESPDAGAAPSAAADASEANPPGRVGGMLALPGVIVPTSPEALSAVVGALIHLHFLKVVELDARLGAITSARDPGTLAFLALPLILPMIAGATGTPLPGLEGAGMGRAAGGVRTGPSPAGAASPGASGSGTVARRWAEYLDHLGELVPRRTVDNLLAALVPRIVQTQ